MAKRFEELRLHPKPTTPLTFIMRRRLLMAHNPGLET